MAAHFSAQDEAIVANKYRSKWAFIAALVPVVALYFTRDVTTIVAIGFAVLGTILILAEARLHDIWIRLGRTNATLREDNYPQHLEHLEQLKSINLRLYQIADALDAERISESKSEQRRIDLNQKLEELARRVQQGRPLREDNSHETSPISDQEG